MSWWKGLQQYANSKGLELGVYDPGAENTPTLLRSLFYYKRSIYQDRLGTNIGKVEKRDVRP
jgi:hypothetical protein